MVRPRAADVLKREADPEEKQNCVVPVFYGLNTDFCTPSGPIARLLPESKAEEELRRVLKAHGGVVRRQTPLPGRLAGDAYSWDETDDQFVVRVAGVLLTRQGCAATEPHVFLSRWLTLLTELELFRAY